MRRLYNITEIVHSVLRDNPEARNSDDLLVSIVWEKENPSIMGKKISYVLEHRNELKLSNIKSIERSRRRLQEKHPELRATRKIKEYRGELEEEYKEYARK